MSGNSAARVLIVDDEPSSVQIIARALAPLVTAEFALSGTEALERLASNDVPDLIVLDVLMPSMNGFEVCSRLKNDPRTREIPVIFVTASREIESETLALQAGASDFIHKPINPQVARLRVGLHILLRQREQALQQLNADLERRVDERTQALSEALTRAETANRAKNTFLANVSHETRTPLNGIIGFASLLQMKETDPDKLRRLDGILVAANELVRVLDDVLAISRLEANQVLIKPQDFAPEELRARLLATTGPSAEAKKLDLTIDLEDLPDRLRGDLDHLAAMLTQLLDNAVKFTHSGAVSLSARVLDSAGGNLRLAFDVSDTGCGVASDARDRIFQSFEQADGSRTREFGGLGLGLAIARQLAALMNGDVRLDASGPQGSTFVAEVRLPQSRDTQ
ncbi:ATP-binding response regulator [Methylolobus aquaticus]